MSGNPEVQIEPENYKTASTVSVICQATDNIDAIKKIDSWARAHDFRRVPSYHLNKVKRNGVIMFQGVCYRWTAEHSQAAEEDIKKFRERLEKMPETTPADELLREGN